MIAVMGTTASGKTDFAESLADRIGGQLINADAFQVYRFLDIGTAKSERRHEYRLIDIRHPSDPFGVGEWVGQARLVLEELHAAGRPAIFVGGTGLYVRALFEGYDAMGHPPDPALRDSLNRQSREALLDMLTPEERSRIDPLNRVRVQRAVERKLSPPSTVETEIPPFRQLKFAIERDPGEIEERIDRRTRDMFRKGWIDEVAGLAGHGVHFDDPGMRAHGYRHIWRALEGTIEMVHAENFTTLEVRRYAKRQRTWLRAEPRLIRLQADDALQQAVRFI